MLQGLWLVPGLVSAAFAALAIGVIAVDRRAGPNGVGWRLLFDGSADAARDILTTVGGSLITVAGLAFSITIVTLQLVSSQFTPRALRGFLNDRVNQVIAGTFVGVFVYCLLVLGSVRNQQDDSRGFVPALGVTLAIAFGVLGFGLLLVFIHRISQSVKASSIASKAARETLSAIDRLYPERVGHPAVEDLDAIVADWREEGSPGRVSPDRPGYVQATSLEAAAAACAGQPVRLRVAVRPGDFVTETEALVEVWPREALGADAEAAIRRAFNVANERDIRQDPAYGVRQLVDVALRAISPGINDPTTALTCIRYLGSVLERLARRKFHDAVRRIGDATVAVELTSFDDYLEQAFVEISRYASKDARVVAAVLDALAVVAAAAREVGAYERLDAVAAVAEDVAAPAVEDARTARDRGMVEERLERVRSACASRVR